MESSQALESIFSRLPGLLNSLKGAKPFYQQEKGDKQLLGVGQKLPQKVLTKASRGIKVCYSMNKRQIIHFSDETYQDFRDYVTAKYGKHRAKSFVVQQAVDQFLEREKAAREEKEETEPK